MLLNPNILLVIIVALISLFVGILHLIKYAKTKKKSLLVLGIILTFVITGIALYLVFRPYY